MEHPDDFDTVMLTTHGATLVFPDLPPHSALGIDQTVHTTSEHFKGVKHVPPGVHVISYAAYDPTGDRYGPVTAFFINIPAVARSEDDRYAQEGLAQASSVEAWMMDSAFHGPVLGWTWVGADEVLIDMDEDLLARAEHMVRGMQWDQQLGSYYTMCGGWGDGSSSNSYGQWRSLSHYVDDEVVRRLAPKEGGISATVEEDHGVLLGSKRSEAELALDRQLARREVGSKGQSRETTRCMGVGRCRYTMIPDPLIKDASLTAGELTAWNLDKSLALERLLVQKYKGNKHLFLGEIQFSFLAFLLGHSLEGFLQWKKMVALLLGCDESVRTHPDFFAAALEVLCEQLAFSFRKESGVEVGGDVLGEHLFDDLFLKRLTLGFIKVHGSGSGPGGSDRSNKRVALDSRVQEVVGRLGDLVRTELQWELSVNGVADDDSEDDGPVIVYL